MRSRLFPVVALSVFQVSAASAATPDTTAFGARQSIQQISLSPDGTQVAVVAPAGERGSAVLVIGLTGEQKKTVILTADGNPDKIQWCGWVLDTRLICRNYAVVLAGADYVGTSDLISVSSDGKDLKLLTAPAGSRAAFGVFNGGDLIDLQAGVSNPENILVSRYIVPEVQTGSIMAQRRQGYSVERVNVRSLSRQIVVQPNENAFAYISDGQGVVRIMGATPKTDDGYDKNINRYLYRALGEDKWQPLSTEKIEGGMSSGFIPVAVDSKLNVAYGLEGHDGRTVLASISLDGSLKHEIVFDQGKVDVDGVLTVGRQQRVVGATFATETRQAAFFDPTLKKLADALAKALPNLPQLQIVDASADENVLLIWAGSDVDPGRYYVYDKRTRQLGELLSVRPQLEGRTLARVQPISFPADDGVQIPGYLTLPPSSDGKNLPLLVMPHGGPSARDEWGFDWWPQYYAARGYAVLQPNFRGSTGYGSGWFERNGFQSWRRAIGDVTSAARWAIAQGIAAKDKVAVVGWSYGGYAALQSAVVEPGLFKAVVAIAPVTDLEALRQDDKNFTNYRLTDQFIGRGPHVEEGSPARHADAIQVPVLLVHGDRDINVAISQSRLMRDRLRAAGKKVDLVEFAGLAHGLEDDGVRAQMLEKSDALLRSAMQLP